MDSLGSKGACANCSAKEKQLRAVDKREAKGRKSKRKRPLRQGREDIATTIVEGGKMEISSTKSIT